VLRQDDGEVSKMVKVFVLIMWLQRKPQSLILMCALNSSWFLSSSS